MRQLVALSTNAYDWATLVYLTRLRRRRLERGWTIQELADRVGMSRRAVGALELGQRRPRPSNIPRLARVLGVTAGELMEPESL